MGRVCLSAVGQLASLPFPFHGLDLGTPKPRDGLWGTGEGESEPRMARGHSPALFMKHPSALPNVHPLSPS